MVWKRQFSGHVLGLLLAIGSGCAAEYAVETVEGPVEPPLCTDVGLFGNGALCRDALGLPDLSLCDSEAPACNEQDVCFDAAVFLACRCTSDVDCEAWADHVNGARTEGGLSSIEARCTLNHCVVLRS
jgi:hypothetical protein